MMILCAMGMEGWDWENGSMYQEPDDEPESTSSGGAPYLLGFRNGDVHSKGP